MLDDSELVSPTAVVGIFGAEYIVGVITINLCSFGDNYVYHKLGSKDAHYSRGTDLGLNHLLNHVCFQQL